MKKIFYLLVLIFICVCSNSFAMETDITTLVEQGNSYLSKVENNVTPELKSVYLAKAQYYFYTASKKKPPTVEALLGLGKVYLLQNRYLDAKNTLFKAYALDNYNPDANFEYAQFCYQFNNYPDALKYYKKALEYKYKDVSKNNLQIAKCYEKLGDLETATRYYQKVQTQEAYKKAEELRNKTQTEEK